MRRQYQKSMVVLVDTNVVLDYILDREPYNVNAKKIMEICSQETIYGSIALHSVSIIWYVLRRIPENNRREWLKHILEILEVVGTSHEEVVKAINMDSFKDFEDCLQDRCAATIHAQYIITNNVKDFAKSTIQVITPENFCQKYMHIFL